MGRSPWDELSSQLAIMYSVINDRIDLASLPVSETFRATLGKATARNPDDRFPDAAAFRDALTATSEWQSIRTSQDTVI